MRQAWIPRVLAAIAMASVAAACSPAALPSASPGRSPATIATTATLSGSGTGSLGSGPSWIAARVDQPVTIEGVPTDAPVFCSPCHPVVGTYIDSLVAVRGGFIALGFDQPPSHAAAWSSTNAMTWRREDDLPAPGGSIISAAVVGQDGSVLAVGGSGPTAATWRTTDGASWTLTQLPPPSADAGAGPGATERLSAVAAIPDGYVAGGYVESATATRTASLWRSSDGVTWKRAIVPVPDGSSEVTGIAALSASDLIAVGIVGDERRGSAAVWQSNDGGTTWSAIASPSFAAGRMLAVAAGHGGVAAVGELQQQTGAAAWFSVDGSAWAVSSGPGLDNGGLQMVMMAVGRSASGFAAAGWRSDAGNGSAVAWSSSDGRQWIHLPQKPTFSGAGLAAVLAAPRLMVAGTMGWPDTHAAEVWLASGG